MYDKRKYYKYLKSKEWKLKRKEVFKIQGKVCKNCGATKYLEINHIHYRKIFNENPVTDLEVLCRECHARHHGRVFKARREPNKSFKKRSKKFSRIFGGGMAMTMDEYLARRGKYSTNGSRPFRG